jgi:hypothetical protein
LMDARAALVSAGEDSAPGEAVTSSTVVERSPSAPGRVAGAEHHLASGSEGCNDSIIASSASGSEGGERT